MSMKRLYLENDALGLASMVRAKEVTPGELLDVALELLDEWNPLLGAVVIQHESYARAQIENGLPDGPFVGVPFLLKNLMAQLEGTETSNCSRIFAGRIADHTSTIVSRYLASGVTIFGKTNSPELGLSGTSDPVLYGPTRNPWNLDYSAGGSSGGSAAAVAAGIVPFAHGSDGGGSIRVPASVCGLVGLKPTRARVPSGPLRGESWAGMACQHVLTRTVRDCAAMLDATAGEEPGDPYQVAPPSRPFLEEVSTYPGRLRIGLNLNRLDGTAPDPAVSTAIRDLAKVLEDLGHDVDTYCPKISIEEIGLHFGRIMSSNVAYNIGQRELELGRAIGEDEVERLTWLMNTIGRAATGMEYVESTAFIQKLGRYLASAHNDFDVIFGPTCMVPAMPLGSVDMNGDIDAHTLALRQFVPSIAIYNMSGQPSISLPLTQSPDGLPIGSMFTAAFGQDGLLFRLAGQLEQAMPWASRRPTAVVSKMA